MVKSGLTLIFMKPTPKTPASALRVKQGARIREYREVHKMTQAELGERVGELAGAPAPITKQTVSMWESGTTTPRDVFQIAIAKALKCPWTVLFGLEHEEIVA